MNLQKRKNSLCTFVLVSALFTAIQAPAAHADSSGSGNCVQSIDLASDVSAVESGNYCYVAFKAGTRIWYTPSNVSAIDYLAVAGGGSGGARHGGGGGAGGLLKSTNISILNVTSISISVGTGGAAAQRSGGASYATGNRGNDSTLSKNAGTGSFSTVTAKGGGGGEAGGVGAQSGGSGGGSQSTTVGAATPSGQGNNGGTGGTGLISSVTNWWSGGGGGADSAGGNGSTSGGGSGGAGVIWLSGFTTTLATALGLAQTNRISGDQVYFAGGGGGAITNSWTSGLGGLGGGGAAATGNNTGTSGTANSGGGGGGTGCCDGGTTGAGGSGIVLIRYVYDTIAPTITGPSSATGLTSSISVAENSTAIHTFTANESVTWTKSGTDGSFFSVTSAGGVLTISSRNFESAADNGGNNTYEVIVTATDAAGNAKSQTLTVTITNVNEAPTISTASSNPSHSITQAENITAIATYTGSDIDAGTTLSWSLSGTDAADFAINSSSGVLSFATAPDFEAPVDSDVNNTYIVIITASDGALLDTQTLTVTITNANENANIGAPTVSTTIYKGISTTITVSTNVAGKVRFFVGGKRISACLARTTTGSYPSFSATCSWNPPVTGRQNLTTRITPTDSSFSATTSAATSVWVIKRSNPR